MAAAKKPIAKDPKKESLIKELIASLQEQGVDVRREKLKTGPGWKVTSGSCRLEEKRIVFVDSRLTQDDQIEFLRSKAPAIAEKVEVAGQV